MVGDVEYRWRARSNAISISIGIGSANDIGPYLRGNLRYHETWVENGDGSRASAKDQIIVTNRIIRRIIEHAIIAHHYDPV